MRYKALVWYRTNPWTDIKIGVFDNFTDASKAVIEAKLRGLDAYIEEKYL